VLFGYTFSELTGGTFDLLYAVAYLFSFGLLSLALAIPLFKRAEHHARIKGLTDRERAAKNSDKKA
jgi:hypothetical protein